MISNAVYVIEIEGQLEDRYFNEGKKQRDQSLDLLLIEIFLTNVQLF